MRSLEEEEITGETSGSMCGSPVADSAEALWVVSLLDTTATSLTGAPPAAEADRLDTAVETLAGDGAPPTFLGATTTLLKHKHTNMVKPHECSIGSERHLKTKSSNLIFKH